MNILDEQYLSLCSNILESGTNKRDRTGTGTLSLFGQRIVHDMQEGFPLLTTKYVSFKNVVNELIWFLSGNTDIKPLIENGCNIWVGDAAKRQGLDRENYLEWIEDNSDNLGKIYGYQWRNFTGKTDQVYNLIQTLKSNPDDRRMLVTAWNPSELDEMILPPCHYSWQVYTKEMSLYERVKEYCKFLDKDISYEEKIDDSYLDEISFPKRKISLLWNQRSVDVPLGLPYNISSYGLLLEMLAKEVNMIPDKLIGNLGDAHIYLNQVEGIKQQIRNKQFSLPQLSFKKKDFFHYLYKDFTLENYQHNGIIKFPLSN